MPVIARQDLAVSLYIPEADVRPSQHAQAHVTSYLSDSGSGNVAADESAEPFTGTTTSTFWLKGIDGVAEDGQERESRLLASSPDFVVNPVQIQGLLYSLS
jgi:hypothetical protein